MIELENKLNYTFKDKKLLELALTHCSLTGEKNVANNQRLEFLGDAVLEHIMSEFIFKNYKDYDEGAMTRLRASIVSEKPLALAAEKLELNKFVKLGAGMRATGGEKKPSILSDTLEAVFAAVYLDGGFEEAKRVILSVLEEVIEHPEERPFDYKTTLQEILFKNGKVNVEYKTADFGGVAPNCTFTSRVFCNGRLLGKGAGTSKKRSEQDAARDALEKLKND